MERLRTGPYMNATEELLEVLKKLNDEDLEKLDLAHEKAVIDSIHLEAFARRARKRHKVL